MNNEELSSHILLATPDGLKYLSCPFLVKVPRSIEKQLKKSVAEVVRVYTSREGKLVYLIDGQLFYSHHFIVDTKGKGRPFNG